MKDNIKKFDKEKPNAKRHRAQRQLQIERENRNDWKRKVANQTWEEDDSENDD